MKLIKVLIPIELTVRVEDKMTAEDMMDGVSVNIHVNYGDVYDINQLDFKSLDETKI